MRGTGTRAGRRVVIDKLNGAPVERDRLDRILSDLAALRPLRCFLPICGAALRCHRNLGHAGECSGASDPDPGRREIHPRRCSGCGAYERRVQIRVVFTPGRARVVCDGCLERVQRETEAWTYCYLPPWRNR